MITEYFNQHLAVSQQTLINNKQKIQNAVDLCINTLANNNKIILCGNGGSAADAQHIAAELVGRYKNKRKALAAISLTTDSSAITSISNDYGYNLVFARQLEALAKTDDVLIAISTSGSSANIIKVLEVANKLNCQTIGFSGNNGGNMNDLCKINIIAASDNTARIQEMHILIGHIICEMIDNHFAP